MRRFLLKIISIKHGFHNALHLPYKLNAQIHSENGPTIVLLHGINGSSKNWSHVVDELKDSYKVITIDLLGFGESQKPNRFKYSHKEHIRSIKHTLDKLYLDEPYLLAGHSMGAILALHYAKKYPRKVSRLVLSGLPYYNRADLKSKFAKKWDLSSDRMLLYAYRQIRKRPNASIRGAKILRKVDKDFAFDLSLSSWYPFHQSLVNVIENQNLYPIINEIDKPIDIIFGRRDRLVSPRSLKKAAVKNNNVSLHKVSGGHNLTRSLSKPVAEIIRSR